MCGIKGQKWGIIKTPKWVKRYTKKPRSYEEILNERMLKKQLETVQLIMHSKYESNEEKVFVKSIVSNFGNEAYNIDWVKDHT